MRNGIFKLTEWISRLAILNLLWIGFSLVGLIIFGLFPATVAMFSVIRQWLLGKTDLPIFQLYWRAFRTDFFKANGYGVLIAIIGLMIYADLVYLAFHDMSHLMLVQLPIFLFILLTFLYLFPTHVHYKLGFLSVIKQAFLIMVIHPLQTITMLIGIAACLVLMYYVPALALFFSGSFTAFVIMSIAYSAFSQIEVKQKKGKGLK